MSICIVSSRCWDDPVEMGGGGVGMPLTGSLMFVYICIDVGDPVEGRVGMPLTGSLLFVYMY